MKWLLGGEKKKGSHFSFFYCAVRQKVSVSRFFSLSAFISSLVDLFILLHPFAERVHLIINFVFPFCVEKFVFSFCYFYDYCAVEVHSLDVLYVEHEKKLFVIGKRACQLGRSERIPLNTLIGKLS